PFPRITESPALRGFFYYRRAMAYSFDMVTAMSGALERLRERSTAAAQLLAAAPEPLAGSLEAVLQASDFLLHSLARDAALAPALIERAAARLAGAPLQWPHEPHAESSAPQTEATFMAQLRRWRRAELARIAWRDLAGWATLDETLLELSGA